MEIYQTYQLIRDAAYQDGAKLSSNEEFELAATHLMSFAQGRSAFVLAEVTKAR